MVLHWLALFWMAGFESFKIQILTFLLELYKYSTPHIEFLETSTSLLFLHTTVNNIVDTVLMLWLT